MTNRTIPPHRLLNTPSHHLSDLALINSWLDVTMLGVVSRRHNVAGCYVMQLGLKVHFFS